jgi:hypothetical protein
MGFVTINIIAFKQLQNRDIKLQISSLSRLEGAIFSTKAQKR